MPYKIDDTTDKNMRKGQKLYTEAEHQKAIATLKAELIENIEKIVPVGHHNLIEREVVIKLIQELSK